MAVLVSSVIGAVLLLVTCEEVRCVMARVVISLSSSRAFLIRWKIDSNIFVSLIKAHERHVQKS